MSQLKLLTAFGSKARAIVPNTSTYLTLPEKFRGGRIEKMVDYVKNVMRDYSEAFKELKVGAKKRPLKATVISTIGLSSFYMNR